MSKQRTGGEIRAYCEAASEGPWVTGPEGAYWPIAKYEPDLEGVCDYQDILSSEAGNADNNADFIVNARADMIPLLDAATGLREMVEDLLGYATEAGRPGRDAAARIWLGETAWLELSPEAPLSPDGENGEESET